MSEKRFERWNDHSCKVKDNQEDTFLNWEDVIKKLNELCEENKRLRKKILNGLFDNCTLENENDIFHLQYVFTLCKLLVDDAIEEVENENIECAVELAEECIYQFESRMKHFNQDKNGEKRVF